ncbi:hypothetical protein IAG25_35545 [Caballeronia sp. EK]|uniref:hypothetical protein n=1 Tax=Caballeronia sp. EK TaxID=2767469 RepID=UPI001655C6B9|nr:hypothetical protein [Caballeronia sp. EK]MBC8642122.1 hypothetical protein [Caballeronia sp. EK]
MDEATKQPKKRGRKPGTPKTGGRVKGTPNKATAEVKSLARQYGAEVIARLADIALKSANETAAIAAGKELLERGYGKSITMLSGPDEGPIPVKNEVDLSGLSPEQLRIIASIKVD